MLQVCYICNTFMDLRVDCFLLLRLHLAQPVIQNEAMVTESWQYNHYIYCGGNATTKKL